MKKHEKVNFEKLRLKYAFGMDGHICGYLKQKMNVRSVYSTKKQCIRSTECVVRETHPL